MKRLFCKICLFIAVFLITFIKVEALSLDENKFTIRTGEDASVNLYANLDKEVISVEFKLVYTSYDVPGTFKVNSLYKDTGSGINHKITFDTPVKGKINIGTININVVDSAKAKSGNVNITGGKATTSSGEVIDLKSKFITVNVEKEVVEEKEEPVVEVKNEKNNLLERIDSDIVSINIKENVYEYRVNIGKEVEELDLTPVLKDDSYKVEVSTQKISELEDNKIIITITKDDFKEEYIIKVGVEKDLIIDDSEAPIFSYKGKWITIIVVLVSSLVLGLFVKKKR